MHKFPFSAATPRLYGIVYACHQILLVREGAGIIVMSLLTRAPPLVVTCGVAPCTWLLDGIHLLVRD
jgi:hypothetical protein